MKLVTISHKTGLQQQLQNKLWAPTSTHRRLNCRHRTIPASCRPPTCSETEGSVSTLPILTWEQELHQGGNEVMPWVRGKKTCTSHAFLFHNMPHVRKASVYGWWYGSVYGWWYGTLTSIDTEQSYDSQTEKWPCKNNEMEPPRKNQGCAHPG